MSPITPFSEIRAISFDIYGTLMDWESGIMQSLEPLLSQLAPTHIARVSPQAAIAAFMRHEIPLIRANPRILYDDALKQAYVGLAREWGLVSSTSESETKVQKEAEALVEHVPNWQPFADTVDAMQRLSKHFKLIALSNVSRRLYEKTITGNLRGVPFDAAYLAQDIGSYKPSDNNFDYLLKHAKEDFGVDPAQLLHVGHGVLPDMVPAEKYNLAHAWIERGHNNWENQLPTEGLRAYLTLGKLADDVERVWGKK